MPWKPEDVETVRELAAKGMSAQQIASHFYRVSRNSIIGLCHRKKIKLLKPNYGGKPIGNTRIAEKRKREEQKKLRAERRMRKPPMELPRELPIPHRKGQKKLMQLGYRDCRAVIGPVDGIRTIYCGDETVQGKSWCPTHMKLYTVPNYTQAAKEKTNE